MKEFEDFALSAANVETLMGHVSQGTHSHIPRYNWVGFYLVDKKDSGMLVLGPHAGSFTPKAKLSLNQGLSGLAASTQRVIVCDNVAQDPHYLQSSDMVKSQICVPFSAGGKRQGVFNVESYFMSAFKARGERDFVESCARIVTRCMERAIAANLVNA